MKYLERFTLLRSLFPSWRFFSEVVEVPVLQYRMLNSRGELAEWQSCFEKRPTHWQNVFFNPSGNIAMAENSLLEYFQEEIEAQKKELQKSVSYALVTELARAAIREKEAVSVNTEFQFRIGLVYQGFPRDEMREILVSEALRTAW